MKNATHSETTKMMAPRMKRSWLVGRLVDASFISVSPQAKRALLPGERAYVLMEGPLELEAFDGRLVVKGEGAMVFKPVPADPAPQTSRR